MFWRGGGSGEAEYFLPQAITNVGSDDILILSLRVCETVPSVCFPLIRVIATNITATVSHDKLLQAYVWRLFSAPQRRVNNTGWVDGDGRVTSGPAVHDVSHWSHIVVFLFSTMHKVGGIFTINHDSRSLNWFSHDLLYAVGTVYGIKWKTLVGYIIEIQGVTQNRTFILKMMRAWWEHDCNYLLLTCCESLQPISKTISYSSSKPDKTFHVDDTQSSQIIFPIALLRIFVSFEPKTWH